jgi:O-antigen ligase
VLLLGWILFAFAGFYTWTIVPLAIGVALLAARQRPRVLRLPYTILDLALIACLAVVALQLVPLRDGMREQLAPGALTFERTVGFALSLSPAMAGPRPASVAADATQWALTAGAAVTVLFWTARGVFARSGLRATTRGIAWLGLALAPLAIMTHATAPKLLYWRWQPYTPAARPYGPFVNRNDLACWLVMALPLTLGYIAARIESRRQQSSRAVALLDATALWLAASVCLMTAALLASVSRAGFTALGVALICFTGLALTRRALTPRRLGGIVAAGVVLLVVASMYVNFTELAQKLGSLNDGVGRRQTIWRFSWQMVRDYWPAGTGLGAYDRAILLYAQPFPYFYINHAHNQYLQFIVEGGLFLIVPAIVAIVSGVWLIGRMVVSDHSPVFWIRAGAASGVLGLAAHSLWDTTLRMPANAALFAVLAAIAMHQGSGGSRGTGRRRP